MIDGHCNRPKRHLFGKSFFLHFVAWFILKIIWSITRSRQIISYEEIKNLLSLSFFVSMDWDLSKLYSWIFPDFSCHLEQTHIVFSLFCTIVELALMPIRISSLQIWENVRIFLIFWKSWINVLNEFHEKGFAPERQRKEKLIFHV